MRAFYVYMASIRLPQAHRLKMPRPRLGKSRPNSWSRPPSMDSACLSSPLIDADYNAGARRDYRTSTWRRDYEDGSGASGAANHICQLFTGDGAEVDEELACMGGSVVPSALS
ncbi:hypothetical protein R3P38DRAFT_2766492 [Favolaschia claudopus]|uniref:Uncharacterized protein n=1 Tax=Favolaschia claudopus TaxID=2862362 RepID=A0AAW0D2S5_9AGAR